MCAVFPVIGNMQSCLRPPVGAAMSRWRKGPLKRAFMNNRTWKEGMAKTPVAKPAEPAKKRKTSPGEFIRQVRAEGSKVVWPTWGETVQTSIFVGIMMLILSLFFMGIDSAFGAIMRWLLTLA